MMGNADSSAIRAAFCDEIEAIQISADKKRRLARRHCAEEIAAIDETEAHDIALARMRLHAALAML